mgnify:CR=1 FL=1
MSNQNNQNAINTLTNIVADFTAMISTRMPDDVVDKLKQLREGETSPMGKIIYHTMFDNMQKAIDLNRVKRGDLIALRSAGAYGEIMASQYNLRALPKAYTSDKI